MGCVFGMEMMDDGWFEGMGFKFGNGIVEVEDYFVPHFSLLCVC